MGFSLFGRRDRAAGDDSVRTAVLEADPTQPAAGSGSADDAATGPSLVLTYDGWRVGRLVHPERRVLDALARDTLVLETKAGGVERIERDEVILVVPPPLVGDSPQRHATQAVPVSVDIGVATLRGCVHILPGTSPWEAWQRSSSGFVALTEASLDFPDGTTETADTVLVSRHAAHSGLLPA
jgi:hypothetical protein